MDEYNLLIAEHFERAEEMALASEYTSRAAQVAAIRGTIDESIAVATRALALLEGVDAPEQRMALQFVLGERIRPLRGIQGVVLTRTGDRCRVGSKL